MSLLVVGLFQSGLAQQKQVMVLPALHGLHNSNPNYTYGDLYQIVKDFDPDVIGVEIRPEEINMEPEQLEGLYPLEMRMIRDSFPNRVHGIDYFGEEFRGRVISPEVFKDTSNEIGAFIQLQQKMGSDSLFQYKKMREGLDSLQELQLKIASEATADKMMEGTFDQVSDEYYDRLYSLVKDGKYEEFRRINLERDKMITENSLRLIRSAAGERMLILVGANHRSRLVKALQTEEVQVIQSTGN